MKVIQESGRIVGVELTRRNLQTLLAKLDGHPANSACTLWDRTDTLYVKAVEDDEHYSDRKPGPVHASTLAAMKGNTP